MLNHGGQLEKVKLQYPDVDVEWLDLSTGIAPWSWPVEYVPVQIWQRLPETSTGLCNAAAEFYGCESENMLSVAGSQVAIELIPECLKQEGCRQEGYQQRSLKQEPEKTDSVAIPLWGYGEHARCWSRAGFNIVYYRTPEDVDVFVQSGRVQHVLAITPNNPSADVISVSHLQRWQQQLLPQGGYLVVDEAFADTAEHAHSALSLGAKDNLIVLRSVGKFFGMAGLRLGFVIASETLREQLQQRLILWGVSNPAQWLGERMLKDSDWQCLQRHRINY
ncbi:aminotransferase class I/II-fold pyridoxal phosphate-dependent enzyme, partial [Pseudomaricurvus sp.]|uniref:aminotransferase class I/II-fold pyridoxal phosphate-dependent enzyme n=1 Tax=Pseudomaricurvus sp. TaxID=2004510 RepID=UPI003F6A7162